MSPDRLVELERGRVHGRVKSSLYYGIIWSVIMWLPKLLLDKIATGWGGVLTMLLSFALLYGIAYFLLWPMAERDYQNFLRAKDLPPDLNPPMAIRQRDPGARSDSRPEDTYIAETWNEPRYYRLNGNRLDYWVSGSNLLFSFDLAQCFPLQIYWQTHSGFRAGLVIMLLAFLAFRIDYAKKHSLIGMGSEVYVYLALFVIGMLLIVRFRTIYRSYILRSDAGDKLIIIRDPKNPKRADDFISRIKALV